MRRAADDQAEGVRCRNHTRGRSVYVARVVRCQARGVKDEQRAAVDPVTLVKIYVDDNMSIDACTRPK